MAIPVVLLHDLGGSARDWDDAAASLQTRGFTIIAPDLPGHGSRRSQALTVESLFDTISAASIEASSAPIVVGVGVGAHLAIASGGSSRGVVALACGTEPLSWMLDSYRIASATTFLLRDGGAALTEHMGRSFGASNSPEFRMVIEAISKLDVRAALRALDVPVRLINGSRDRYRMQERAFIRAARDSALVRVPGIAVPTSPAVVDALVRACSEIAVAAPTR